MARSIEEIEKSLVASIDNKDNTIDVTNGPVYDTLIQPVPRELSLSEAEAARLAQLHSTFFAAVATPDEVDALRVSMRLPEGGGQKATGLQMFYSSQIPPNGLFIPQGSLVATSNGRYTYRTTIEKRVGGDTTAYFNTETFRNEFIIPIEAIAAGTDYNIPVSRINRLVADIEGVDGTENTIRTTGGTAIESQSATVNRIQTKFVGFDRGTGEGLISTYIQNVAPTLIKDTSIVRPKDSLFKRLVSRPALDIYVSGKEDKSFLESYTVTAQDLTSGTVKIESDNAPVLSITSVELQHSTGTGVEITPILEGTGAFTYQFVKDDGIYAGSTRANDGVWVNVSTGVVVGDIINIQYISDNLIIELQGTIFNSEETLFDTDALIKKAVEENVIVDILAKLLTAPSDSRSESILADLESTVRNYIDNEQMGRTIIPEDMRQTILAQSPNVINIFIRKLRKITYSLKEVEVLEFNANEIPKIYETSNSPFSIDLVK